MGKRIVILNGGPRPAGNTAALIAAFTEGAQAAGHTVTRLDLCELDIHGCRGCMAGGKDAAHPCVQRDDMDRLYPAYQAAEVVVLASPMYYWGVTGQLKCAIDRLYAVEELPADLARHGAKEAVLLMPAGDDTEENFAPALAFYRAMLSYLGWRDAGTVCAGGNLAAGDIRSRPDQLEAARALGASLA